MLSFYGHSGHNTQANFVHALIFKTMKLKDWKDLKIFASVHSDIIRDRKGKMNFLNQNSNYMIKNLPRDQIICSV